MRKHIFTVAFMVGVTFVYISIISGIHLLTADTIARNAAVFEQRAVFDALNLTLPDAPAERMATFRALVEALDIDGRPLSDGTAIPAAYRVRLPDRPEADPAYAMVIREHGAGLWGTITALVGFDPDGRYYRGVVFLDHSETPGLGARIDEHWFRNQFVGATGPYRLLAPEPRDKSRAGQTPGAVDQITGATASSRAVMEIMNKSARRVNAFLD